MERLLGPDDLKELAPAGFHIALRIGFAFPLEEENALPVLAQAQTFGLRYGVAVSVTDRDQVGLRSFGSFARGDREFNDLEIRLTDRP